ncbi:MAG: IgGFc-binding protein, partial [Candidatus Kapabacteria bacterium]|nr:IgGFc-binding protein [Candidatus Kapabacteria bacterium]
MKNLKFIVFTILTLISSINIYSLDTRGKDFWFNFMPNLHGGAKNNFSERTDSLLIFMAAEVVTNCTIEYTNASGLKYSSKITITNPKQVYTFKVYWKNFELIGFNNLDDISNLNQCEEVAKQSFHIVADNNISVIAHSKAKFTNDAFLVFPTPSLGKEYYILSYNSDGDTGFNGISEISTPSQFSITAVEDNTSIEIFPKVATVKYGNSKQTLNLNKGESYLVQARITVKNLNEDLTGSYIKSDKPIAVFGGHQRATLPYNAGGVSRDILVEQMVPINFWGRNAYIVPFQPIKLITSFGTDLFRIIAAFDSTEVYLNGDLVTMLNAGEYFEGVLDQIYQVESSGPILVAEYKKSSDDGLGGNNTFNYGDPFMVLVPPKEQFSRIYRCVNAQVYDIANNGGVEASFREQYVTLVAPDLALSSVKIDGVPVQLNQFQKIYKSGYSVVTAKVKDGTHDITCDEEVGIFIYGYGPANSYGYIGGMSSKNIDFNPPVAEVKQDCDGFSIFSLDTNIYDSGIDSILTPSNLNNNIVFNIPTHSDTVNFRFTAKVIDKYQDAKMTVIIKDSIGYSKKITRNIKGFTVGIKNLTDTLHILDSLSSKAIKCYDIELFNYGKYTQTFDLKFAIGNTKMTLSDNGKITIDPGKSKIVQVCYNSLKNPNVIDSLLVVDSCASRMLATFNLISVSDTSTPSILIFNDPCSNSYKVNFVDST